MINFVPKLNWVKKPLFIIYFFLIGSIFAQELRFSANFILSQKPLNKVQIKVLDIAQNKIIDNFNSENSDKVKIDMETGNNYRIYFSHPKIHPIFFEIIANNMSENDLYNKFDYQMDIDFIPNTESNVDTAFLSRHPIHRVIFNNKKFEDDIKYNTWAESKIFKEESLSNDFSEQKFKIPYNIAGTLFIKSGNNLSPLLKRDIILYKTTNKPYYTKQTNVSGQFHFSKVYADSVSVLYIDIKEKDAIGKTLVLTDSKKNNIKEVKIIKQGIEIPIDNSTFHQLIDNRFSYFIGGKIFKETDTSVTFYAEQPVFLLNHNSTVIQSTKTNIFGAFVFSDIKPGAVYQIAIKKESVKKPFRAMLYNNTDIPICEIDSANNTTNQLLCSFRADNEKKFDELLINESLLKMNIKGKVFNENTNNPIADLKVYLVNDKNQVMDSVVTDNYGSFIFAFVPYMKYSFKFYDPNNIIQTASKVLLYSSNDQLVKMLHIIKNNPFIFSLLDYEQKRLSEIYAEDPWLNFTNIKLKNKNIKPIIENIYFETNQYTITREAEKILSKIIIILKQNTQYNIEIKAFTDSRADDKYNMELSQKRANAVKNYFIAKGVDANRITATGLGETKPLNHCKNSVLCTEDEHAINRRVEFDIKLK